MIRVALVDDHALIREGMRRAIERADDMRVAAEAASVAEGKSIIRMQPYDVLVVDLKLPDGDGLDLVAPFRRHNPAAGIVVLTMYGGDDHLLRARSAGASRFIAKDAPSREVVAAIREAFERPTEFKATGLADALARRESSTTPQLTRREREVLALLGEGLGVSAISGRLFISESTTKTHVAKIYGKLGATNRASALMAAIRLGLLEPEE